MIRKKIKNKQENEIINLIKKISFYCNSIDNCDKCFLQIDSKCLLTDYPPEQWSVVLDKRFFN